MNYRELIAHFPTKKGLGDFITLGIPQIAAIFSGFITTILWTNFVSQETYGKYNFLYSTVAMVSIVSLVNINVSANISAARKLYGNFFIILRYKLLTATIGSVILGIVTVFYHKMAVDFAQGLLFLALVFPLINLNFSIDWLIGEKKFKSVAFLETISHLIILTIFWLLVAVLRFGSLLSLLIGLFGAQVIINIIIFKHLLRRIKSYPEQPIDKKVISYGMHASLASTLSFFLATENIIVGKFLGFHELSIYVVARIFPDQIKSLFSVISRMMFPHFVSITSINDLWKQFFHRFILSIFLFLVIGIAGFFAIDFLVPLLFSQRYSDAAIYGKWMFLTLSVFAPVSFFNVILQSKPNYKNYLYYQTAFNSFVSFVGLVIMVPRWGLWGATFSRMLYYVLVSTFFIISFIFYLKKEQIK